MSCTCPPKQTYVSMATVGVGWSDPLELPPGQYPPETGVQMPVGSSAPYGPSAATLQLKVGAEVPPQMNAATYGALNLLLGAHQRAGSPLTTITEWYRNATQNLKLAGQGSVANSQHQVGTAFDLRADPGGQATALAWRALGGQTIDERTIQGVTPHWHLELSNPSRPPTVDA